MILGRTRDSGVTSGSPAVVAHSYSSSGKINKISEGSIGAGRRAVGGGDIAGALKLGTCEASCALIATVHQAG
jgi:hypothetical protein